MPGKRRQPKGSGSVYRVAGSQYWQISYTVRGKRRTESSRSTRKTDAHRLLQSRVGKIADGHDVNPRVNRISLGEGLRAVVNDQHAEGRRSIADTRRRIDLHLIPYFGPARRMATIGTDDINAYVADRLDHEAARATINRELACLRRAFSLAINATPPRLVSRPPIKALVENNVRKGFFREDDFAAVLENLPYYLRPPLRFAYITGWRIRSEVLPLDVSRVDLEGGCVRLEPGETKNDSGRQFPLTNDLRAVLEAQLDSVAFLRRQGVICPHVFHCPDGRRILSFYERWRAACRAAGVPGRYLHDFRRTAVRNLERAGVPRSTAMSIVGHQTQSIYTRYAIQDESMQQEAARRLDSWANRQKLDSAAQGRKQTHKLKIS